MPQTKELKAQIAAMDAAGVGSSDIARRLGVTKNVVIGIRARMKPTVAKPLQPRPLIDIPSGGCQFINGPVAGAATQWCRQPVSGIGSPWCAEHHAVVYVRGIPKGL